VPVGPTLTAGRAGEKSRPAGRQLSPAGRPVSGVSTSAPGTWRALGRAGPRER